MNTSNPVLKTLSAVMVFCALMASIAEAIARPYPTRPITNTVVWSAGGGTDAVNRMVMAEMSKELGMRITVTNKPGGVAGSIGMSSVVNKRPDGYNLVGISSSNVVAGVNGGWSKRFDTWSPFIVGSSPDVISVHSDSKYTSLKALIDAAKKAPNTIRVAAGGMGGIHHLYLLELSKAAGVEFKYVPYPGSAPSQTAAVTKEVDAVVTSMAEQAQLLRGQKLRPLAMLHPQPYTLADVGEIGSAFVDYPALAERLPLSQAIGFAVHAQAPAAVKQRLGEVFEKVMKGPVVTNWAKENHYELSGLHGEPAQQEFARLESIFTWALQDLGATKVSPAQLGIPKP